MSGILLERLGIYVHILITPHEIDSNKGDMPELDGVGLVDVGRLSVGVPRDVQRGT
jgi:hypothetical protein